MAQKPEIQYIEHFFVPGAEAPQLQPKQRGKFVKPVPPRQEKKICILVDPVALVGLVVAVTMLVLMAVGVYQFSAASQEHRVMQEYLLELQDRNITLEHDFRTEVDLDVVREQALALGMIPMEEARTVTVKVEIPTPEPEPAWWEDIIWFLEGLFA